MCRNNLRIRTGIVALMLLALAVPAMPGWADAATARTQKQGVVFQVSDSSPATWNQVLNLAENIPTLMGKENVEIEIVAFGQGLNMLKFDSEVGNRLKKAADSGVALRACAATMKRLKLSEANLYPDAGVKIVPTGVLEIMQKSQAGWFHIRP